MRVCIISEQSYAGKVPDDSKNLRVEHGWMKLLDAPHIPYSFINESDDLSFLDDFELVIFIPSKSVPDYLKLIPYVIENTDCKTALMQEGPVYFWQDWSIPHQSLYLSLIRNGVDLILTHNTEDRKFFKGITITPVLTLPTVNHTLSWNDYVFNHDKKDESVFVGGNFTSWYNGISSFLVASNNQDIERITLPSMGRKPIGEEEFVKQFDKEVTHLPYMSWDEFMKNLATHKYAIHLIPTYAAGSFSLNSAMLGIPCIGPEHDDTQRLCFPELSINPHDNLRANFLLNRLINDKQFYDKCRQKALAARKLFDIDTNREIIIDNIKKSLELE